jgi:SAM-dependent methyltransferase
MSVVHLDEHATARDPDPFAGPDNPMRRLTRAQATGEPWTGADAVRVRTLFDEMAPAWSEKHVDADKAAPVVDALDRGTVPLDGRWLEVGSGTGAGARIVSTRVDSLICTDLSEQMLLHAPDVAPRVRSDASSLPFATDSVDAVLLINMILFPAEIDRVVRPNGVVVWVNTLGDQTPIHLPPEDVVAALPGAWTATTARAGTGFWAVARRAS